VDGVPKVVTPLAYSKKAMKEFGLSREDAQNKGDWRWRIYGVIN